MVRRAGRRPAARSASTAPAGPLWCAVERRPAVEALFPDAADRARPPVPGAGGADRRGRGRGRHAARPPGLPGRPPRPDAGRGDRAAARDLVRSRWPGWRPRASRSAAGSPRRTRRRSGAPGGCWPASTATPGSGSAARSSRSAPRTSCGSCCAGSTWRRAPSARAGSACSASSSSCRASSWPPARGRTHVLPARVDRLPPRVARRAVPVRPGQLGPAVGALHSEPRRRPADRRSGLAPSRATPITLAIRDDLPWLLRAARGDLARPSRARAAPPTCSTRSASTGRCSGPIWPAVTGRLPGEVEEALWDGVARGLVTADGFRRRPVAAGSRPPRTAPAAAGLRRAAPRARPPARRRPGRALVAAARPAAAGDDRGRAGRGRGRAAARPLGRGVPRPGRPGRTWRCRGASPVGPAPDGGPRHHPRRPVRHRVQRRAVRPPGRRRRAARGPQAAPGRRDGPAVRRRPAEPDRRRAARPADPAIPSNTVTYVDGAVPPGTTSPEAARTASSVW